MGNQADKHSLLLAKLIPEKRLYTIEEAAVYLGRTIWSVRELIWKGVLPCVKIGRRVHLDRQDMNTFIERYKIQESM